MGYVTDGRAGFGGAQSSRERPLHPQSGVAPEGYLIAWAAAIIPLIGSVRSSGGAERKDAQEAHRGSNGLKSVTPKVFALPVRTSLQRVVTVVVRRGVPHGPLPSFSPW